ncbi:Hypothetical protein SMAX5B_019182 [Scophthalmus maximus]|uniref:Uncharacterized protein n=1 Tax=Scophthalmus maximus TaxID=52904 RepID=A0A2U9C5G7_SCOMX|nr:Hypothetical protein SMAX5B_019182 [Scophthalmus maximus]KAF0040145.1 hypothetical protein F2P81_008380 [Scophthalmus maximus]
MFDFYVRCFCAGYEEGGRITERLYPVWVHLVGNPLPMTTPGFEVRRRFDVAAADRRSPSRGQQPVCSYDPGSRITEQSPPSVW